MLGVNKCAVVYVDRSQVTQSVRLKLELISYKTLFEVVSYRSGILPVSGYAKMHRGEKDVHDTDSLRSIFWMADNSSSERIVGRQQVLS